MISQKNEMPSIFEKIGNGKMYYHCNIVEVQEEPTEEGGEPRVSYEYHEIEFSESDTRDTLTRLIIREFYKPEDELKMINESHTTTKYAPTDEYKAYLEHRKQLIDMVNSDWEQYR